MIATFGFDRLVEMFAVWRVAGFDVSASSLYSSTYAAFGTPGGAGGEGGGGGGGGGGMSLAMFSSQPGL